MSNYVSIFSSDAYALDWICLSARLSVCLSVHLNLLNIMKGKYGRLHSNEVHPFPIAVVGD